MNEQEIKDFLEGSGENEPSVKKVDFPQLQPGAGTGRMKVGLDYLSDVNVKVSAQLGRAQIKVKNLLNLEEGSVLELDRPAGETVDMYINEQLFGRAEVVVIGNNFGLRIDNLHEPEPAADKARTEENNNGSNDNGNGESNND